MVAKGMKSEKQPAEGDKTKKVIKSRSLRAGLQFPVGRIHRFLKETLSHRGRVGATAAVYSAAILVCRRKFFFF